MDIRRFSTRFEREILHSNFLRLAAVKPFNRLARKILDPCPDVMGMASYKKLMLMNLVASLLAEDPSECYLEVGTFQGKSLVAALRNNPLVSAVACDNFSEFDSSGVNQVALEQNLRRHGLHDRVKFFNMDFRKLLADWYERRLPRIGGYFYDGAHDKASQYDGIKYVEPHLADRALVVVDDSPRIPGPTPKPERSKQYRNHGTTGRSSMSFQLGVTAILINGGTGSESLDSNGERKPSRRSWRNVAIPC